MAAANPDDGTTDERAQARSVWSWWVAAAVVGAAIAAWWLWMRRYRVWEANRKVFLFPENWLEPESRDDASPLFDALEASLRCGVS